MKEYEVSQNETRQRKERREMLQDVKKDDGALVVVDEMKKTK